MTCRWKDEHGDNMYDTFIPEVERPAIAQDGDVPELQPGEKRKRQPRRPTDKGALFYSTVAMFMSGSHTFVVFTPTTRQ